MSRGGLLARLGGGRDQRGLAEAGVALTGAALVLGAALGSGVAATAVQMSDGVTWLPDEQTGQVVQVNPATGRAERRLDVAAPGSGLELAQRDGRLLVTDTTSGTVTAIDLATLLAAGQRGDAGQRVLVGGGRVVIVDLAGGAVRVVDPLTLRDLGAPWRAGGALADAVLDDAGVVWVATRAGEVRAVAWSGEDARWVPGERRRVPGAGPGTRLLPHGQGVTAFAPDAGTVLQVGTGRAVAVDVRGLDGEVLPAQEAPRDLAPAAVPSRSAVVLLAGDRFLEVEVGALGCARPGRPAVFAGLVHVPCTGDGRVVVLGPDGRRARPDVVVPVGRDPRLLVDDGRLVVHTEDGSRAVAVEADGSMREIDTRRGGVPAHDPRAGAAAPAPPPGGQAGAGRGAPPAPAAGPAPPPAAAPARTPRPGVARAPAPGPRPTGTARPAPGRTTAPAPPSPSPSATSTAAPAPDLRAPTDVEATVGDDGTVTVRWSAPDGGADGYLVGPQGGSTTSVDGAATSVVLRDVAPGTHRFVVQAVRGSTTRTSEPSPAVTVPGAPGAVAGLRTADVARQGGAQLAFEVRWDPPADNGSPVTGYDVSWTGPVAGSRTTTATNVWITQACGGTAACAGTVTVTVVARNAVGTGPAAVLEVVPEAPEPVLPAEGDVVVAGLEADEAAGRQGRAVVYVVLDPPASWLESPQGCELTVNAPAGVLVLRVPCSGRHRVAETDHRGTFTVVTRSVEHGVTAARFVGEPRVLPTQAEQCDQDSGCTGVARTAEPDIRVIPVPWAPQPLPDAARPPLAATGVGLLLAAAVLRAARRRAGPAAPTDSSSEDMA